MDFIRQKIAIKLLRIPVYEITIILLGCIMINEFFVGLNVGWFTPVGFFTQVMRFVHEGGAPLWWKSMLIGMANHAQVFALLLEVFLAVTGILAVLLILRGIVAIVIAIFCFMLWITQWQYPSSWIFELLFPATIGLCAGIATLRHKILGDSFFGKLPIIWRFIFIIIASAWLWYAFTLSKNGDMHNLTIAWQTAISVFILLLGLLGLDQLRSLNKNPMQNKIPWADIIIIIIGAMLIVQVYADAALQWYTTKGYAALAASYAKTGASPKWFKSFLSWSAQQASIFVYAQAIFETAAAVTLTTLILRGPMLLLSTGLFAILMYAEFGVVPHGPAHLLNPPNWVWELMFVTIVGLFLSLQKLGEFINAKTIKDALLGPKIFNSLFYLWRILIAVFASIALSIACYGTHIGKIAYINITWQAGLTFFICLIINAALDYWRKKAD